MLKPASGFKGLTIAAVDGDLGGVADLYFDDLSWTVRYLVVDTGTWLPGRQVLISPLSVREAGDKILVDLNQEQVKGSPPVESDKPVNRQQEEAIARYYDQRYYWEGPYRWGLLAYPGMPPLPTTPIPVDGMTEEMAARERGTELGDPSLRSTRDVTGYYIAALDGDLAREEGRPVARLDQDGQLDRFAGSRRPAPGRDQGRARVRPEPAVRPGLREPAVRSPPSPQVLGVGGTLSEPVRESNSRKE